MLFTGFYAVVIPFSIIFGMVQIFALYWVYKWNLLRRSNLNRIIGHMFPFSFLELYLYLEMLILKLYLIRIELVGFVFGVNIFIKFYNLFFNIFKKNKKISNLISYYTIINHDQT